MKKIIQLIIQSIGLRKQTALLGTVPVQERLSGWKKRKFIAVLFVLSGTLLSSCFKDLDTRPLNEQLITSTDVFEDPESYKQFLAKLYGAMTLTGQRGEFGLPEISATDEGTTSFLRLYWSIQEITTDECLSAWGDPGLTEFNGHSWSAQNAYNTLMYQRVFINIAYCNEYIREVGDRVDDLDENLQAEVRRYLAEARFMRAYYYWVALDLWGNVPFVTEEDEPGAFLPEQISRTDLFFYIESELQAALPQMADPGTNEYARADKAAASMLLAKLYLNAEVYLGPGNAMYTECLAQLNSILNSGVFSLADEYHHLFLADNHLLRNEIILPVAEDGDFSRNYGGVTYIIHAAVGGSMDPASYGIASGGWSGNRFIETFVNKFEDPSGQTDSRALFYTAGQTLQVETVTLFTEGFLSTKFQNVTSTGTLGTNETFVDTDFPLFRLADVYLMYAEAVLRGGSGGDEGTALDYVNQIRERAYGNDSGNILQSELTLDFLLEERARELHWETHRRTDLIRFGKFAGGSYIWNWKGDVQSGAATPSYATLFPIPASDIAVNTNLVQNPGY